MESGCTGCFGKFLGAALATIRKKIQRRGVRQRRRNFRITKAQAIRKLGEKRGKGVMANMDVVKLGARNTKRRMRRAQLQASGWKQRREDPGVTKKDLQEKVNAILLDFQERRKAQRVRQRAQSPHPMDISTQGDRVTLNKDPITTEVSPTLSVACCPLRGKKAHSGKWQDMVLEGVEMVQANMEKGSTAMMAAPPAACCPLRGKKAHCAKWQGMVLEGMPVAQVHIKKCPEPVMEVSWSRWRQKSLREALRRMEKDNVSNSPTVYGFENGCYTGQGDVIQLIQLDTGYNKTIFDLRRPVTGMVNGWGERKPSDLAPYEPINTFRTYPNIVYGDGSGWNGISYQYLPPPGTC